MDEVTYNLAEDYLQGAGNYLYAAEVLCNSVPENTRERFFYIEDPLTFLIGHASELILKAALAFNGYDEGVLKNEFGHDLVALQSEVQKKQVQLDPKFSFWIEQVAENFKNFDQRYPRIFSGFPDKDHERLSKLITKGEKTKVEKNEIRKYGLIVKSKINPEAFIKATKDQIQMLSDAFPTKSVLNAAN